MPAPLVRVAKSWSNQRLAEAVREFVSRFQESVLVLPCRSASGLSAKGVGSVGVHKLTLTQLAASLARPEMAARGLAPLNPLGVEAVSARVVFAAMHNRELGYYAPVATSPGFARALARTIGDLRLGGIQPETLAGAGAPAADLARLLERYQAELATQSLCDLAELLRLAGRAAADGKHRLLGLPIAMLDAPLETTAHRELFKRLSASSPEVLLALTEGGPSGPRGALSSA